MLARCSAPLEALSLEHAPSHFRERIAQGKPLKIVAIGSSSTSGAGASSRAATYPSRLEAELKAQLPGLPVTVLNKGIGGEEAPQMVARFEADVFEEAPDLVLWQVGSNSVLRDHPTPGEIIRQGVERLKDERRRSDPDQSAIRAEDFGEARRRTNRRRDHRDRARRRGRAVRSLRGDAPLVGDGEDSVRPVHHAGSACT